MTGFTIQWSLDEHLTARARAVQHALIILQATKTATWDDLADQLRSDPSQAAEIRAGINLPLEDLANLDAHEQTLRGLRRRTGTRAAIITTILECGTCQRWAYIAGGSVPKNCPWTLHCTGSVTKIGPPDAVLQVRT
ncbi:hypothetical protein [Brachybacterium atlanticum]|uniref:hypothetical protein n=1 Tax=Brachybacterium atlanticum TaxID=2911888 RepID=UPI0021DF78F2|nr:hypothetical protein [Brachybacterium atlanticum]